MTISSVAFLSIPGGNAFARVGVQGLLARASDHQHPTILPTIENEVALASLGQHHIPLLDPSVEFIQLGVRTGQIVAKFQKRPQLFHIWCDICLFCIEHILQLLGVLVQTSTPVRSPWRISSSASSAPLVF